MALPLEDMEDIGDIETLEILDIPSNPFPNKQKKTAEIVFFSVSGGTFLLTLCRYYSKIDIETK